ncbi:MAG: HAD family hydrolase [Methylomonas sp.]
MVKAIIFDMDGLVIDSEASYVAAWRQTAVAMGYQIDDDFALGLSGANAEHVKSYLLEKFGDGFDLTRFRQLSTEIWLVHVEQYGIAVKPGFFSLLELIQQRQIPFCLATNSQRIQALRCLSFAGLDGIFQHIIARDDVLNGKPAPDLIIKAADVLAHSVADCLVLEDSPIGIAAAVAAGARSVYLPSQPVVDSWASQQAVRVFDDLGQVATELMQAFDSSLQNSRHDLV